MTFKFEAAEEMEQLDLNIIRFKNNKAKYLVGGTFREKNENEKGEFMWAS